MTEDESEPKPTSGVTPNDIVSSIEMILGRTPDQALVDYHMGLGFVDRADLGRYMLSTHEFRDRYRNLGSQQPESDVWAQKTLDSRRRKEQLHSFGPYAQAILLEGKHGSFVVDPEDSSVSWKLL